MVMSKSELIASLQKEVRILLHLSRGENYDRTKHQHRAKVL
jgi:hypothetical protein